MSFANPNMLWLLLVFPPALLLFFWWSWRKRQDLMTRFIQARLLSGLVSGLSPVRQRIRLGCLLGAVACLIVALARPQWGFTWQEVKQRGVDIVVAIDVSKSMLAEDIAPNRLARAKLAALDLMHLARSDRLGLVAFAGTAFLQCPLTIDDSAFRQGVESLNVNTIPQGGTALAEAIQAALTAYKEGDNHKVLVLMTDGEDQDSGALEAAQKAAESGLKIFTIGLGTPEGQLLKIKDAQGKEDYIRDEQGNVVKSHLNERLLQEMAGASQGGFYLPLRGAKTMEALYNQGLAPLPKTENQAKLVRQYQDRYHWPLALAIVLLIVETLLPERKREPRAGRSAAAPAKSALQPAAVLLLLFLLPAAVPASNSSALREYKAGKYEEALKEYQRLLERKTDDPRLHFNAGAAAYRSQQFDEAAKQFNQAKAAQDLKLQELAYYNHGNSLYWMGEKNEDPTKRKEAWEQAVKDYDLSLKLNGADPDAKFNKEFVTKKLEELKQQQQQNQKNDKNKQDQNKQDQNQQQQSQQDQQKKDDSKQDQSSQQQQQQDQQQKQDSSQQNQASQQQQKQEDQKQQQAASQPQDQKQQQKQQPQQANASKGQPDKKDGKDQQAEAAYAAGQMTPEQAERLLDAQKSDEMMLPVKPEGKPADRSKPLRDW